MRVPKFHALAAGLVLFSCAGLAFAATPKVSYHLLKKYNFGPAPGSTREYFDYVTVDSAARRVYLSHGTEVKVVNADNGKVIGNITGLKLDHGVAVAHEFNRGFITDGAQGKVIIFNLKTLKVIGEAPAEKDADGVAYDPASKRIFVMDGDPGKCTVIDAKSGSVVNTVTLPGKPEFAVSDGRGTIFANIESKSEIAAIDSHTLAVKSVWPVAPAGHPAPLAIDTRHRRLFTAGRSPHTLVVLNADDGKVIQSFPISSGADAAVFEPSTGLVFVSTFEGFVHIFHEDTPDKFRAVSLLKTELGAKTMGLDTKTHKLYLDTAQFAPAPAPTAEHPHPRRATLPGTFHLLVYARSR